ncbi:MAG: radical SAM protein [Anaerolineaceae bacterium]|nr:radical SAM protein [Anaerolineaceae bacterium]NTV35549.1 radical SAM protein [Anaerolineaceae bacterium]
MDLTSAATLTKTNRTVLAKTASVCPVCLKRIPAERVAYANEVYLEKTCPEHGDFKTILWRGRPEYTSWMREKIPNHPRHPFTQPTQGCPFDCGLCADHRQEPCCVLLEVTRRCDLGCPVCFASAGGYSTDPEMSMIEMWYRRMLEAGGPYNIQLSGGEPSLRDDLPEIIALGKQMGFSYFQVNTNGLRIAEDREFLKRLKDAGLGVVYLQFDGTHDHIYETLRGRSIFQQKVQAIQNCQELHLGVVLVPTIMPGINSDNIGSIIRFALEHYPTVRSIHLQPVSFFGRYPKPPENQDRITIPELLQAMQDQTSGLIHLDDFQPKGSENSFCSFHATYVILPDGSLKPIKPKKPETSCCCKPENAKDSLQRSKEFVAKNWVYNESIQQEKPGASPSFGGWDTFLERTRTHLFSISGMAFQDAWNLDLELLQDCCINIAAPDGNLVPFCAYNLTNAQGQAIYRPS